MATCVDPKAGHCNVLPLGSTAFCVGIIVHAPVYPSGHLSAGENTGSVVAKPTVPANLVNDSANGNGKQSAPSDELGPQDCPYFHVKIFCGAKESVPSDST